MDAVVAVLAKLQEQENPFVCEEEIEDLYCMKMQVGDELKRCHEERMKSSAATTEDKHIATELEIEKAQAAVAEDKHRCAAAEEATHYAKRKKAAAEAMATAETKRIAAELKIKQEQEQIAAEDEERCYSNAKVAILLEIKNLPTLKNIKRPSQRKNHLVIIGIHLQQKLKATKYSRKQKETLFLLQIT